MSRQAGWLDPEALKEALRRRDAPVDAFTIAEAAQVLAIPAGTIRRWVADGHVKRYGQHRPWLVSLGEIGDTRRAMKQSQEATRFEHS